MKKRVLLGCLILLLGTTVEAMGWHLFADIDGGYWLDGLEDSSFTGQDWLASGDLGVSFDFVHKDYFSDSQIFYLFSAFADISFQVCSAANNEVTSDMKISGGLNVFSFLFPKVSYLIGKNVFEVSALFKFPVPHTLYKKNFEFQISPFFTVNYLFGDACPRMSGGLEISFMLDFSRARRFDAWEEDLRQRAEADRLWRESVAEATRQREEYERQQREAQEEAERQQREAAELEKKRAEEMHTAQGAGFESIEDYHAYIEEHANPASDFICDLTEDGTGVMIIKYVGTSHTIVFPSSIEDIPVKQIGKDFSNGIFDMSMYRGFLFEKIIVPDSVERITGSAFKGMRIHDLSIASSVKYIQGDSISYIRELTSLSLPQTLNGQLLLVLDQTCNLEELDLPRAATEEGYNVYLEFYWHDLNIILPLKRIVFGDGITRINLQGDMRAVESVSFPSSLKYLTGRLLLNGSTQFSFQGEPSFEYKSTFGRITNTEELMLFIATDISLTGKKAVRDFWNSMKYDNMYQSQDLY